MVLPYANSLLPKGVHPVCARLWLMRTAVRTRRRARPRKARPPSLHFALVFGVPAAPDRNPNGGCPCASTHRICSRRTTRPHHSFGRLRRRPAPGAPVASLRSEENPYGNHVPTSALLPNGPSPMWGERPRQYDLICTMSQYSDLTTTAFCTHGDGPWFWL
jgi:hypothetical protein